MNPRRPRRWIVLLGALAAAVLATPALADVPEKLKPLYDQAEAAEKEARWIDACFYLDQILKADPTLPGVRGRFQESLRHAHQLRRHRDPSFLKSVLSQDVSNVLDLYQEVLKQVRAAYVDQDKVQLRQMFHQGLHELRYALIDETFLQEHLRDVPRQKVQTFRQELDNWLVPEVPTLAHARRLADDVANKGVEVLGLNYSVTILELVCGACNGLDEYTFYLTPSQLQYVQSCLKGEQVGVGIKVAWVDGKLLIAAVLGNSPAYEKGLKPGDRVVRIDGQGVENLGADGVAARLVGKQGSTVELDLVPFMAMEPLTIKLVRQPVFVPSVEWDTELREGVGYIRILNFQETTPQEVREAVLQLRMAQMKALVIDLRGNGGGHVRAAAQVAELFLRKGLIATTDSHISRFKAEYKANNPHAWTSSELPLVVLVDGETASAAELVAGALKEHERATLVGTPTFGKGSVQCPLTLQPKSPTGVWITVAKFYSPSNQPYSGRGVTPHIVIPDDGDSGQRAEAVRVAANQVMMMPPR